MDLLQFFFTNAFHYRNFDSNGLVERLRFAKLDALTLNRFFNGQYESESYLKQVCDLIRQGNDLCLEKMSMAVRFMADRSEREILDNWWLLEKLAAEEKEQERRLTEHLDRLMAQIPTSRMSLAN